jgi:hypothetical protein
MMFMKLPARSRVARRISLGDAVAELVRHGLKPSTPIRKKAFPCFAIPADAAAITLEQTLEAEDEI